MKMYLCLAVLGSMLAVAGCTGTCETTCTCTSGGYSATSTVPISNVTRRECEDAIESSRTLGKQMGCNCDGEWMLGN